MDFRASPDNTFRHSAENHELSARRNLRSLRERLAARPLLYILAVIIPSVKRVLFKSCQGEAYARSRSDGVCPVCASGSGFDTIACPADTIQKKQVQSAIKGPSEPVLCPSIAADGRLRVRHMVRFKAEPLLAAVHAGDGTGDEYLVGAVFGQLVVSYNFIITVAC